MIASKVVHLITVKTSLEYPRTVMDQDRGLVDGSVKRCYMKILGGQHGLDNMKRIQDRGKGMVRVTILRNTQTYLGLKLEHQQPPRIPAQGEAA